MAISQGFKDMRHHSQSLDLNPLENIWDVLRSDSPIINEDVGDKSVQRWVERNGDIAEAYGNNTTVMWPKLKVVQ